MELIKAIILGLVQGLTEFIPVSSSGHLILVGHAINFSYSGLAFDTALDIGTLAALLIFFWKDFWTLARDVVLGGKDRKLALYIIAATIPAVVIGVLIQSAAETIFRSNALVALNLIWVGLLMWWLDKGPQKVHDLEHIRLPQAVTVGFAQALALIPGTSRSGITITIGRALQFDRVTATRFSFLMSAPIIAGATLKVLAGSTALHQMAIAPSLYLAGIVAAFISGYWAIAFMIRYLSKHGLALFAYYRIAIGLLILLTLGVR